MNWLRLEKALGAWSAWYRPRLGRVMEGRRDLTLEEIAARVVVLEFHPGQVYRAGRRPRTVGDCCRGSGQGASWRVLERDARYSEGAVMSGIVSRVLPTHSRFLGPSARTTSSPTFRVVRNRFTLMRAEDQEMFYESF